MLEWRVSTILERIKKGGDTALKEVINEVESFLPTELKVSETEFETARRKVPEDLKEAINAAGRLDAFHRLEVPGEVEWTDQIGVTCRRRFLPVRRVGLYIPEGAAPLFSFVLMLGVPSMIAGCPERVICTPPSSHGTVDPSILYAASVCGIKDVFKIGGAQAIAAMAYGTNIISKVDKIFGPGNSIVAKANGIVSKEGVAVDLPAGPSELMVLSDESANVTFMAADLLSRAENGPDSQVVLLCESVTTARRVIQEMETLKGKLPRKDIVEAALAESRIIVFGNIEDRIAFANLYAPGRLILAVENPEEVALRIEAAGSVFLGHYSPDSAGDYVCGTNQILPSGGQATAWSGVGVESFMRAVTYQSLTKEGLASLSGTIITMAEAEMSQARAETVKIRL